MKSRLVMVLFVMLLVIAGCSSAGDKSASSENGKLGAINTLMNKGYEMTQDERQAIAKLVEDGKALAAKGQQAEADKLYDAALKKLELIAETDRFNKSE